MRLLLVVAVLVGIAIPALAQTSGSGTLTVAPSGQAAEICRGQFLFILTPPVTAPGSAAPVPYTFSVNASKDQNINLARFLVASGNIVDEFTMVGNGGGAMLFVALEDPQTAATIDVHVEANGTSSVTPIAVPAARSTTTCPNPAFYGAPSVGPPRRRTT